MGNRAEPVALLIAEPSTGDCDLGKTLDDFAGELSELLEAVHRYTVAIEYLPTHRTAATARAERARAVEVIDALRAKAAQLAFAGRDVVAVLRAVGTDQ